MNLFRNRFFNRRDARAEAFADTEVLVAFPDEDGFEGWAPTVAEFPAPVPPEARALAAAPQR